MNPLALLPTLLNFLANHSVEELTGTVMDLFSAVTQTLNEDDQLKLQQALAARRMANDEGHARLQALLEEAKKR